jgi:tRNA (guanine-N7-)-methyltransferase
MRKMARDMRRVLKVDAPELRLDPEKMTEPFEWDQIFNTSGAVEIEIGIGKGLFILTAASSRPEVQHLGIEWANKYLRIAESRALKRGLENIKFVRMDAKDMMTVVPANSVSAYYVFYPDPWPKKRQLKRRFLCPAMATQLVRSMTDNAVLHVATDHVPYWSEIEPLFDDHPDFERLAVFGGDQFPVPADEPLTNFEIKYRVEGRARNRGSWRRKPRD